MCLYSACTQPSFVHNLAVRLKLTTQNPSLASIVCPIQVFTMGTRKSSRRTKPLIKLTDKEMDDLLEDSATPQQISEAVNVLSQVESMIKHQRSLSDE